LNQAKKTTKAIDKPLSEKSAMDEFVRPNPSRTKGKTEIEVRKMMSKKSSVLSANQ
jgi:hypothetical protein